MWTELFDQWWSMCYVAPIGDVRCHGAYVWSAYGLSVCLLVANLVYPLLRGRKVRRSLRRLFKREESVRES
jgi:heme exporter protein CcmD